MRIYRYKNTVTAAAGAVSFNTLEMRGEIRSFQVKPETATTRYTLTITNDDSVVIHKASYTGNLVDERMRSWYGVYTIAITAATADENFTFTVHYTDLQ